MNETIYMDTRSASRKIPEISFIVPVYNTRDYLVETLNSIAADNLDGIELIIVNDGSTDDSLRVVQEWVQRTAHAALVLNQPNNGLSAARMTGIKHANGQFIGFCDSDDRIEVSTHRRLVKFALERDCDVALCRSVVLDDLTHDISDFYDGHIWNSILAGRSSVVTTLAREPRLMRLEPNANTRLLRRSFITDSGIQFPYRLHFEDLPPHVAALSTARRIALVDATGYYYRINRIGKITDQKSAKRFDIISVAEQAFSLAHAKQIGDKALANLLALVSRMIYWCGENTLNGDRRLFFQRAALLVRRSVPARVIAECIDFWTDEREALIISALAANSIAILCARARRDRVPIPALIALLGSSRYGRLPRRVVARIAINRAGQLWSGLRRAH
jgi:glycosyltransferase involved in cell wall biosynthesis